MSCQFFAANLTLFCDFFFKITTFASRQRTVPCPVGHTAYDLLCANAVAVIAVVVSATVYSDACKLFAVFPCQVGVGLFAVVVVQRVAVFIGNRRSASASRMPRATGA